MLTVMMPDYTELEAFELQAAFNHAGLMPLPVNKHELAAILDSLVNQQGYTGIKEAAERVMVLLVPWFAKLLPTPKMPAVSISTAGDFQEICLEYDRKPNSGVLVLDTRGCCIQNLLLATAESVILYLLYQAGFASSDDTNAESIAFAMLRAGLPIQARTDDGEEIYKLLSCGLSNEEVKKMLPPARNEVLYND